MKTATMLSMPWLTTVVTLGLFWLVTTQGLALEMVAALLVFLMEKQQFVNVSLCKKVAGNPYSLFMFKQKVTHLYAPGSCII